MSCLAGILLALHASAPAVPAAEIVVDPDGGTAFSTLSGAVAAAPAGAVIRVRPGIYAETVTITTDLTLVGTDPGQGAVLDGAGRRPLLRITAAVTCRLENLSFRRGLADRGGAMTVAAGAVVDVIHCSFLDNTARQGGGAVWIAGADTWAEFLVCHFQHNRAGEHAGAVAATDQAELTLRGCTFFGNTATADGGAVVARSPAPLTVQDCLFIENEGGLAGAVLWGAAPARITGNTFFQNLSLGGAAVAGTGTVAAGTAVTNNIFAADLDGAGLDLGPGGLRDCNIYFGNLAGPLTRGELNPDERVIDPGFCDFRAHDLTLRRNSPAAARASSCGHIGALDVGCLEGLEASGGPRRRVH